jgi:hypothetical protein
MPENLPSPWDAAQPREVVLTRSRGVGSRVAGPDSRPWKRPRAAPTTRRQRRHRSFCAESFGLGPISQLIDPGSGRRREPRTLMTSRIVKHKRTARMLFVALTGLMNRPSLGFGMRQLSPGRLLGGGRRGGPEVVPGIGLAGIGRSVLPRPTGRDLLSPGVELDCPAVEAVRPERPVRDLCIRPLGNLERPAAPGTDVSHGWVHVRNSVIARPARVVLLRTAVRIASSGEKGAWV